MTRTERTYYLVFGLYNLSWSFLGPTYALFLLSRGLDLFQINLVLATYLITAFVFEVPTGAVADLYGRKVSFVLSCVVRMSAFALYAFCDSFAQFLCAEFIDAVGTTLASGSLSAWAVDGMQAEGDRRATDRFFARAHVLARALMIVSGLAAGYLAEYGLALPWLVAAGCFGLTAGVGAVLMREERPRRAAGASRSLARSVRTGVSTVRATPVLSLLCGLTLATAFGTMPAHILWQPRLQGLAGGGLWLMGWVWALLNVASLAGSALIPTLLGRLPRQHVLCVAALWRAATLGLAALATGFFPALAGFLLQELGFGLSEPLLEAWMNERTEPAQRATVLSVRAMAFTLGGAAGLACIGLLARGHGIPLAWGASATVLALTAPAFLIAGRFARAVAIGAAPGTASPVRVKVSPSALG